MLSAQALQAFLAPVVKSVCEVIGLREGSELKSFDPVVLLMAQAAYSGVVSFTRRQWIRREWSEVYSVTYGEDFELRHIPVESIAQVNYYFDNEVKEAVSDYHLSGNRLLVPPPALDLLERVEYTNHFQVYVRYIAGLKKADEFNDLFTALVTQTIANYNKRNLLGIRSLSGNALVDTTSGALQIEDAKDLLPQVKQILSPYVYYRWVLEV